MRDNYEFLIGRGGEGPENSLANTLEKILAERAHGEHGIGEAPVHNIVLEPAVEGGRVRLGSMAHGRIGNPSIRGISSVGAWARGGRGTHLSMDFVVIDEG